MAEFKDETDEVKAEVEKHQQSMVTKDEVFDSGEGADPEETKRIAKATAMNEKGAYLVIENFVAYGHIEHSCLSLKLLPGCSNN